MIISASRRTDIPAFFAEWFMNRIREGYCTTVNPFNRNQVTRVSLAPNDVDVIVFWTKNVAPLLPHLDELNSRGYRYYFQYTVNGYPSLIEPHVPDLMQQVQCFEALAQKCGPGKVVWRYDPILLSNVTNNEYHLRRFAEVAAALRGLTERVVVSVVDEYRKAAYNFKKLKEQGVEVEVPELGKLSVVLSHVSLEATAQGMEIFSCAENLDLRPFDIKPGKCIDGDYIQKVFGISVAGTKDKNQRQECGCIVSKDIGAYDTCLHGCSYCYAGTLTGGRRNHEHHCSDSPSILGHYGSKEKKSEKQLTLF